MIIEKNIEQYIAFEQESVREVLRKIDANRAGIAFVLNQSGVLEGVLTDGDLRRWMIRSEGVSLESPVNGIANKDFQSARMDSAPTEIQELFSSKIRYLPLLDANRRVVAVARPRTSTDGLVIGDVRVDDDSRVFVIAEIGINHNGDFDLARELVERAAESGADCAKFQMRDMDSLYRKGGIENEDLGTQYTLDLLNRFELKPDQMYALFDLCREKGMVPLCTPWDLKTLERLAGYGMPGYKIASADLTNHELIGAVIDVGKPLIISTGMSTELEIKNVLGLLNNRGAEYALLHCNSTYPAPFNGINLKYMERLKKIGRCPVGYSGHERGWSIAVAAAAMGAKVIEKHFTLDKNMEGNDHRVSLLPDEMRAMIEAIRQVEEALGEAGERVISQGEMMNRVTLAKSLVINRDLEPGETIERDMIEIKGPGRGLQPDRLGELVGRKARREFKSGDFFFASDLEDRVIVARDYKFKRKWGVPVRYHDYRKLMEKTNPDFLEFHLSYKDMDADFRDFITEPLDLDLVVHSPDLFAGDHLLNLCDPDEEHRARSIRELQRCIDLTLEMAPLFTKCSEPLIVASLGGYTRDAFVSAEERRRMYALIGDSLSKLNQDGVRILPQTLPPFPWYFGGQLYLNLFVDAEDTAQFCEEYGYGLCLDISHSKLACNHSRASFSEFVERTGPLTKHLHIVDAAGLDGEGIQIDEGEVDFAALARILERTTPEASFIPEIWQGHKNNGEGFWIALERLEKYF